MYQEGSRTRFGIISLLKREVLSSNPLKVKKSRFLRLFFTFCIFFCFRCGYISLIRRSISFITAINASSFFPVGSGSCQLSSNSLPI